MHENHVAPSDPEAKTPAAAPAKGQVVRLNPTSNSLLSFSSEQKTSELKPPKPHGDDPSHVAHNEGVRVSVLRADTVVDDPAKNAPASRRLGARVVVALLVLAVAGEAGYIGYTTYRGAAAIAPETGSLNVTSDPSGAAVTVDGTPRGATPLTVPLPPGTYQVQVGTGQQARNQPVIVTAGGTFSLHLAVGALPAPRFEAGTGGLQIATEPPGQRVWIDGAPNGVAPVTISNLKAGDHVVTVRGNSGDAVNRTVAIQEGAVASLLVSTAVPGGFASGWLALTSSVPLQIFEKGTIVGTTEAPRILLPVGAHQLELVNEELGYRVSRSVQITAGQTATMALRPPMASVSINAVPWAEVLIDGQRVGETPIGNFAVAIGKHDVVFRHPELGEQRRTITVGVTATPLRLSANMRKP